MHYRLCASGRPCFGSCFTYEGHWVFMDMSRNGREKGN